jgi:fructosamine-3-kinase
MVRERIGELLGVEVAGVAPLSGGCVAEVHRVELGDGRRVVVKVDRGPDAKLDIEGMMLDRLHETGRIPVPGVLHAEPGLLVMEHVEHDGRRSEAGEATFADRLASLHGVTWDRYGFEADTLIGSLDQPNPPEKSWARFFAEHRLSYMGRLAEGRGALPRGVMGRLERLAGEVEGVIEPGPERPALIHGDAWAGNVLWNGGELAALIDPAVYFADPEIELAFIDLMGSVGRVFWDAYGEAGTIRPGFWERRRTLYNLYPLLVHAALFGGGYGASVSRSLGSLGY